MDDLAGLLTSDSQLFWLDMHHTRAHKSGIPFTPLPKAEEGQDCKYHNDGTNDPDDVIHSRAP
jgi:hypothetical protein